MSRDWIQILVSLKILWIRHFIRVCHRYGGQRNRGYASCSWLNWKILDAINKMVSANALKERYLFLKIIVTYLYSYEQTICMLQIQAAPKQLYLIITLYELQKKKKTQLYKFISKFHKKTKSGLLPGFDLSKFYRHICPPISLHVYTVKMEADPDVNYRFNLSTFSTFPELITLKPGCISKIARKFRYIGGGTADTISCTTCSKMQSGWSDSDAEVYCQYCAENYNINNMEVPSSSDKTTASGTATCGERRGATAACGGACSDESCTGCHAVSQRETGTSSTPESIDIPHSEASERLHIYPTSQNCLIRSILLGNHPAQLPDTNHKHKSVMPKKDISLKKIKPLGIFFWTIRHIQYVLPSSRRNSFGCCWPSSLNLLCNKLAFAGFFFTGKGDITICFYCGIILSCWRSEDDPLIEHAHWSPLCAFQRANKEAVQNFTPERDQNPTSSHQPNDDQEDLSEEGENVKLLEGMLCRICSENLVSIVFVPCGHLCCCPDCKTAMTCCPICHLTIKQAVRIWMI